MRKFLIAGNWKMNTTAPEAKALVEGILDADAALFDAVEVLMCPPFTNLAAVTEKTAGTAVHVGGQNMHEAEKGAFTGEISAAMLTALGCSHVILGHSERRQYFHETDVLIHQKLVARSLMPSASMTSSIGSCLSANSSV